jgi:hypothetical protein
MVRKAKKHSNRKNLIAKPVIFKFRRHRFKVFLDNILIFNFFRKLHGRFWGIASMVILFVGFGICFMIRPDLIRGSTAFSDFGLDVRTAPYFAGSVFFAAYGLWRWRNYLKRTLKRTRPILALILLTIFGLYIVALMPISWKPWPFYIHLFGMSLVGVSIAATVVFDILLSKTRKGQNAYQTRLIKMIAFMLIIAGGWITIASEQMIQWMHVSLLGETMMMAGYGIWIIIKTRQGEEPRSTLSRLLKRIVLID